MLILDVFEKIAGWPAVKIEMAKSGLLPVQEELLKLAFWITEIVASLKSSRFRISIFTFLKFFKDFRHLELYTQNPEH